MPVLNLDQLNDTPVWDGSPSFSGGMVSNERANLLKPNQSSLLQNMDTSISGALITRRGIKSLGTTGGAPIMGIAFYQTPTYTKLLRAVSGFLVEYNGSDWPALFAPFVSADRPVHFAQGVDQLYFAQTDRVLRYYNGTATITDLPNAANTDPPFGIGALVWHTNRLCAAGITTAPDTIYFSQFLDGTVWNRATWNIRVGAGEGDPITGLISWTGFNLIVIKQHSIWVVACNPTVAPAEFQITKIHGSIGSLAPQTAVQVGTDVFLLTDSGVRSIKNIIASEQQKEVGPALSYPVGDLINRINQSTVSTACGFHWNNRYFLSIPVDGSAYPNYTLVFNTLTESWSGFWTGWNATCFAGRIDGGVPKLWMGRSDGTTADWMDYIPISQETSIAFKDMGSDYASRVLTRAFTCNEPVCEKTGFQSELEFDDSQADATASLVLDDTSPQTWQSFSTVQTSLSLPLTLPFTLPKAGIVRKSFDLMAAGRWRELQIDLNAASGKLELRTITVSAFIESLVIQT